MTTSEQPAGVIPGVNILEAKSTRISADGKTAMVVFRISENGGIDFAVTIPVSGLGELASMIQDLRRQSVAAGIDPGATKLRKPRSFAIGNSPTHRGHVFVTFDEQTPHEETYVIADADARNLSAMVERDVLSRMTMQERRAAIGKAKPMLLPGMGSKLILPGG